MWEKMPIEGAIHLRSHSIPLLIIVIGLDAILLLTITFEARIIIIMKNAVFNDFIAFELTIHTGT